MTPDALDTLEDPTASQAPPEVPIAPSPAITPPPTRRGLGWRSYLAVMVAAAAGSAMVVVPVVTLDDDPATATQTPPAIVAGADDPTLATAIAASVGPSVVRIDVTLARGSGSGSGVVYTADGLILTNAHVVSGARQVTVTLPDSRTLDAEIVGVDVTSDIAVIRVAATGLPVPAFATSAPQIGETALAIGSPFGLDGSVTEGIVSALNRKVTTSTGALVELLQTDAAINPGNSGGALVNGRGEVIGINTAIASTSGGSNGIGFAIPIGTALDVAEQLVETGSVQHALLGVTGGDVTPAVAAQYGLDADAGALIASVSVGTPAASAGLQAGDIVIRVDDQTITAMAELAAVIQRHRPGDTVTITVLRDGATIDLPVTLAERPAR